MRSVIDIFITYTLIIEKYSAVNSMYDLFDVK